MAYFRVTYEIVTYESAENGEAAESGFVLPGEWHLPIAEAMAAPDCETRLGLRDAMALAYPDCDCGRWFAESDGREDYATGARETRAVHPPANITRASYGRLRRLFGAR